MEPVAVLRGHQGDVTCLEFACEGASGRRKDLLLAGDSGGWVKVWDCCGSRRPVASVHGHPVAGGVLAARSGLAFGECRDRAGEGRGADLYTQGRDGAVLLWDVRRGGGLEACGGFQTRQVSFCAMGVLPSRGLVACATSELNMVEVWDARSGEAARAVHVGGAKGGMCMAASLYEVRGTGRAMGVFGWEDGSVAWVDVGEGRVVHRSAPLDEVGESVVSLALCREGRGDPGTLKRDGKGRCWAAVGTTGGRVALLSFGGDGSDGSAAAAACPPGVTLKSTLAPENRAENRGVGGVAVRPDARILATAGWDGRVRIYSVRRPRPVATLKYHTGAVNCVAFAAVDDDNGPSGVGEDEDALGMDLVPPTGDETEGGRGGRGRRLLASAGADSAIALWDLF